MTINGFLRPVRVAVRERFQRTNITRSVFLPCRMTGDAVRYYKHDRRLMHNDAIFSSATHSVSIKSSVRTHNAVKLAVLRGIVGTVLSEIVQRFRP